MDIKVNACPFTLSIELVHKPCPLSPPTSCLPYQGFFSMMQSPEEIFQGYFPMNKIILLLIALMSSWTAHITAATAEDNEHIIVRLATDSQLMPLYLAKFYNENSGFDQSTLDKLEHVLHFDLNYNGMTYTVKHTSEQDALSARGSFEALGNPVEWKALNVFYVIKIKISDKKLSAKMLSVNNGSFKSIDGIPLNGDMAQDRRQIHKVADMIHKALFGTDGIASTRFLYTIKTKTPGQGSKWLSDVWEADYDGHNARKLNPDAGYCVTPVYVPPKPGFQTGSFFYVSYKTGQPKIYVASLKDGIGRRLTLLKGNQLMPVISRQRDQVAFICDTTGNPDLFLQSFSPDEGAIGKPRQIFRTHQATQGTPAFSPDGTQIAFVSNKDGAPRIYVMDIPETGRPLKDITAKLVSKHCKENTAPSWSPDGTKLAYCAMTGGIRQIWIYDFSTRQEYQLTQGPGNKENPTWAPNSLHLIFNSSDADASELYLINLNQPTAKKISSGTGEKRFPSWQPR